MEELAASWLNILNNISGFIPGPEWLWVWLAIGGRILYVGYLWLILGRQLKNRWFSKMFGGSAYEKFKIGAIAAMNLDGIFIILASVKTSGEIRIQPFWFVAIGIILIIIGITVKTAAILVLGSKGYHWNDFFLEENTKRVPTRKGIYKYLSNPIYDLLLHPYGWALVCLSWKGLVIAAFAQAMIKLFGYFVERPNFIKIYLK